MFKNKILVQIWKIYKPACNSLYGLSTKKIKKLKNVCINGKSLPRKQ